MSLNLYQDVAQMEDGTLGCYSRVETWLTTDYNVSGEACSHLMPEPKPVRHFGTHNALFANEEKLLKRELRCNILTLSRHNSHNI